MHKPPWKGLWLRVGGIEEAHEHPRKAIYCPHKAFQLRPGPQPLSALPALAFLAPRPHQLFSSSGLSPSPEASSGRPLSAHAHPPPHAGSPPRQTLPGLQVACRFPASQVTSGEQNSVCCEKGLPGTRAGAILMQRLAVYTVPSGPPHIQSTHAQQQVVSHPF